MAALYFLDTTDQPPPGVTVAAAGRWLDRAELARLADYRSEERAREFLLGRYLLKSVLRLFHGVADPQVTAGERDKPALLGGGPRFSLAHAGGAIALVVSAADEVGIDVEPVRPHSAALAEAALGPGEREAVRSDEDFFRVWTAKEAFCKRAGLGLAIAPRRLTVDLARATVLDGETGQTHRVSTALFGRFVVSWL